MNNQFQRITAATSASLLLACGGGGSDGGTSYISTQQAIGALTAAKSSNTGFVNDMVYISYIGDPLVALTAANWSTSKSGVRFTANCASSGTYSYVYSKYSFSAGLTAGDYYSVSYSQCVQSPGGVVLSGDVVMVALTRTTVDQNAGATLSLPISITLKNYNESSYTSAYTYNGTVTYTRNDSGVNGVGSANVVGSTPSLTVDVSSAGVTSSSYGNAAMVYNVPSVGAIASGAAFDVTLAPSGSQLTVEASLVGPVNAPTNGTYMVTNVYGGRVVGSLPSYLINIDYGNDGIFDASFYQAF
jgi:hypothetical protein